MFGNLFSNILGSKRNESYYAFINGTTDGVYLTVVDCNTEAIVPLHSFFTSARNLKQFVTNFTTTFKEHYKAIILNVFDLRNLDYPNNIELCNILKNHLLDLKVPFYFISTEVYISTSLLVAANLTVQIGEEVIIALVDHKGIMVTELRRAVDGYETTSQRTVSGEEGDDNQAFKKKVYGNCNPKRIIASGQEANLPNLKLLRKVLKSNKLIVFEGSFVQHNRKFLIETVKWLLDKTYTKYALKPKCIRQLYVSHEKEINENALLTTTFSEPLPLTKTLVVPRITSPIYFIYGAEFFEENMYVIHTHEPEIDCHQTEFILTVDIENMPNLKVQHTLIPQIEALPETLDKNVENPTPFVGFFGNSSVICVCNSETGKYEFLKSWNGIFGRDIYLNVEKKKPVLEDNNFKKANSIIDFHALCSLTLSPLETKLNDGFQITNDAQNPHVLKFNYFDGTRRRATPAFLMALILKEHILEIKKVTGTRPKKLGIFYTCDDEHQKTEIQSFLKNSCNLLNIQVCE